MEKKTRPSNSLTDFKKIPYVASSDIVKTRYTNEITKAMLLPKGNMFTDRIKLIEFIGNHKTDINAFVMEVVYLNKFGSNDMKLRVINEPSVYFTFSEFLNYVNSIWKNKNYECELVVRCKTASGETYSFIYNNSHAIKKASSKGKSESVNSLNGRQNSKPKFKLVGIRPTGK
jgi:hypothetical protein